MFVGFSCGFPWLLHEVLPQTFLPCWFVAHSDAFITRMNGCWMLLACYRCFFGLIPTFEISSHGGHYKLLAFL